MNEVVPLTAAEVASWRPFAAVIVTGVAAFLIMGLDRWPNVRDGVTVVVALCKFALVASLVPTVLAGRRPTTDLGTFVPGVEFAFQADPLGTVFALVASGLYVVTAVYSVGYMRGVSADEQTRFFAGLAASLSATMGVAFATNLLVLVVFYELLTIATYPLVAHDESTTAREAGYKYLVYAFSGGVVVLAGTLVVFWAAGTVTFDPGGISGLAAADPTIARTAFVLLVVGFGVKAAVMPLHSWLPSAMVAPTPVSGLLHAVAVVKSGVFGIARTVLEVFGPATAETLGAAVLLAVAAGATILIASLLALRQDNIKRLLAYSTIAQLSYIVLGLALLTPAAITGALLHLPAHAFAKLTLFFCAGALHAELHVDDVSDAIGVGTRMPVTMGAFALASASMAGVPLFAGFTSKWHLLRGAFEVDAIVVALFVVSGVLNVAYFWPVVYAAFFETAENADPKPLIEGPFGGGECETGGEPFRRVASWTDETSVLMLAPILATLALVVLFGIVPWATGLYDLVGLAVEGSTGGEGP